MGDGGLGAVSRSEAKRRKARCDRSQGASPAATGGDVGADQVGQNLRGPADCTTGAPVSKSRDGAPVEKSAAAFRGWGLALLLPRLASPALRSRRGDAGRAAGDDRRSSCRFE